MATTAFRSNRTGIGIGTGLGIGSGIGIECLLGMNLSLLFLSQDRLTYYI